LHDVWYSAELAATHVKFVQILVLIKNKFQKISVISR
jgi:hypothetical protein